MLNNDLNRDISMSALWWDHIMDHYSSWHHPAASLGLTMRVWKRASGQLAPFVIIGSSSSSNTTPWLEAKNKNIWSLVWIIWFPTSSFDVLTTNIFFLIMISVSVLRNMTRTKDQGQSKWNQGASIKLVIKLWDENNTNDAKKKWFW